MPTRTPEARPTETAEEETSCPLCDNTKYQEEKPVSVAALRDYWRQFDYHLDTDFPGLPDNLSQYRCLKCGLHWFEPVMIGPPTVYENLAEWPPYYRSDAWEWDIAINILQRHKVGDVLEVGSGTGEFLERAGRALPRCEGLEFNPVALAAAQSRGSIASDLPLKSVDGGRSAIVAFQLLEHLGDPDVFLETCAAKLGPGGLLIVAVPNQDGFIGMLDANYLNRPPHHATLWRQSCFQFVATRFELDFVEYRTAPLELEQYKIYLQRNARPSPTLAGKLHNLILRVAIDIVAPVMYLLARRSLAGEAQIAVFRKPAQ
jgi:SAM-dependent methyltransferase